MALMSPGLPGCLYEPMVRMMAIIKQWEGKTNSYINNTRHYLFLTLFKMTLDATVLCMCICWRRLHTSFLSMCGLSIIVADMVMVVSMGAEWFLGPVQSPVSVCSLLAHSSAAFAALPLPMMGLGLLDHMTRDNCIGSQSAFCRCLRNMVFALLVWVLAIVYSLRSVTADMMEIQYMNRERALVCEVQESMLTSYVVMGLFIAVVSALLPYGIWLPQWFREVNRLFENRDKPHGNQKGDFFFSSNVYVDTNNGDNILAKPVQQRPSLWLSLTLGFGSTWMPYLSISVTYLILGFAMPAYITVNLPWLECMNSLLVGIEFWIRSDREGPCSHFPDDDFCSWHIYWQLSKGTYSSQQKLPTTI